ncbi:MAG: hypothetical protein GY830_01535 [Bacteroidetes bacterium]|nr:hypothetical protein [Bacteroidota bacterium]
MNRNYKKLHFKSVLLCSMLILSCSNKVNHNMKVKQLFKLSSSFFAGGVLGYSFNKNYSNKNLSRLNLEKYKLQNRNKKKIKITDEDKELLRLYINGYVDIKKFPRVRGHLAKKFGGDYSGCLLLYYQLPYLSLYHQLRTIELAEA